MALRNPPKNGSQLLEKNTFKNNTVLISGGGTGIGKGIALEFARTGADIAILSRNPDHLSAGVKAIQDITGKVIAVACDVRDPAAIATAFDEVESKLSPISMLVNNAAGNFPSPAEEISPNGWKSVVDIVLNGTFYCSRGFALRRLKAGEGGAIVNIAATYAWTGGPGTSHSAAAKAGVVNMTQSLAVEWAPDDILVNGIAPGKFPHEDLPQHMRHDSRPPRRHHTCWPCW